MILHLERVKHALRYHGPCTMQDLLDETGLKQHEIETVILSLIRTNSITIGGPDEDTDMYELKDD